MRTHARGAKRYTRQDGKLFWVGDVREASEPGPIPGMGEQTRLHGAGKKIPMRHQSSGRHAPWLTKSSAAQPTPRLSTRLGRLDGVRGRAGVEPRSPSVFLTTSTSSTPAMRMPWVSPSAAGPLSSSLHPRVLRSPITSTRRSVRPPLGVKPKRTHTQRSCPCFGRRETNEAPAGRQTCGGLKSVTRGPARPRVIEIRSGIGVSESESESTVS